MKKTLMLTIICSIVVVASCLNVNADDVSAQIQALEQRAARMQSQINIAKQQSNQNLEAQVKSLRASIDSLLGQRVQLDAHIARMESQIEELKQNSASTVNRQVKDYQAEIGNIKQQIGSLMSRKGAEAAAKSDQSQGQSQGQNQSPKPTAGKDSK
jgi:peptidoglycan hydrolase CwlO-like protein